MRVGRRDLAVGVAGAAVGICLCLVATPIVRHFYVRRRTRALFSELVTTPSKYSQHIWREIGAIAANSRYPVEFALSKLDGNDMEPHVAIDLIVRLGDIEDIFSLRHLLQHPDREIRLSYVAYLPLHPEWSLDLVAEALEDDDEGVRWNAFTKLLSRYGIQDESYTYLDVPSGDASNPRWDSWVKSVLPRVRWDKRMQAICVAAPVTDARPNPRMQPDAAVNGDGGAEGE